MLKENASLLSKYGKKLMPQNNMQHQLCKYNGELTDQETSFRHYHVTALHGIDG